MRAETAGQPRTEWRFEQAEEIAPGHTALKRAGGGRRYDAYLAWLSTLVTRSAV